MTDFVIIGGGVIGCSTAFELARAGARVAVLDRGPLGGESSWAGAGLLFPLLPWDYRPEVAALAQAGRRLFSGWAGELAAESGVDPEFTESGLVVLPPYDRERALAWAAAERETLAEVSPRLVERGLSHPGPALLLPQVAQVRNPRLIAALRGALARRGVTIVENVGATRLLTGGGQVTGVAAGDGRTFRAERYVLAAGAWSAGLLSPLGLPLAVRPVRGEMLLYRATAGVLSRMVLKAGRYIVPRRDGHVLVGSTLEEAGFDKSVTEEARRSLEAFAQALVPALRGLKPVRQWAGLRPGSPDNVPVIDRHPCCANLWVHTGHFRYGVTMAPASARLLADLLLGRPPLLNPAPFRWPEASLKAECFRSMN